MGRSKQPASSSASKFFCSFPGCLETFTKLANLRRHTERIHEKEENEDDLKYLCEECGKRFRKRKQLYDHRLHVHSDRPTKCLCPKCPASFNVPSKLKAHMKRHDGYQCPECDFQSETWSGVRRHKSQAHPPQHKCPVCQKGFRTPYVLKKHERVHQKVVKCPSADCEEKFLPWHIAAHVKTNHVHLLPDCRQVRQMDDIITSSLEHDQISYQCSDCGKTFAKARNLHLHERNSHDGTGPRPRRNLSFACTVENCTRRFVNEVKLQAHLNWHTGEKSFSCPEVGCTARFAGRCALQRHVKLKHLKTLQAYEAVAQLVEMCGNTIDVNEKDACAG